MSNNNATTSGIVSKVWAFSNTLRDDGLWRLSGAAYLFAVFKDGRWYSRPPHNRKMPIPTKYN